MGSRARRFVSLFILTFMVVVGCYVFSLVREDQIREERNVEVPTRDGINLSTNIYRPDKEGRFPVILVRTPYNKEKLEPIALTFVKRGIGTRRTMRIKASLCASPIGFSWIIGQKVP